MRHLLIFFVSFTCCHISANADEAVDRFLNDLKSALEARNSKAFLALFHQTGEEGELLTISKDDPFKYQYDGKIKTLRLVPLPEGFSPVKVASGKKYEPNAKLAGMVEITYEGSGKLQSLRRYCLIEGLPKLAGTIVTDLDWKGPPDQQIHFSVSGSKELEPEIKATWNASGVTRSKSHFLVPSLSTKGQYFEAITVTNRDPDATLILKITHNFEEVIYQSEPLVGKGTLSYQKNPKDGGQKNVAE